MAMLPAAWRRLDEQKRRDRTVSARIRTLARRKTTLPPVESARIAGRCTAITGTIAMTAIAMATAMAITVGTAIAVAPIGTITAGGIGATIAWIIETAGFGITVTISV